MDWFGVYFGGNITRLAIRLDGMGIEKGRERNSRYLLGFQLKHLSVSWCLFLSCRARRQAGLGENVFWIY